jgi:hypothetical protein
MSPKSDNGQPVKKIRQRESAGAVWEEPFGEPPGEVDAGRSMKFNDRSRLISLVALANNFSTCSNCAAIAIMVLQHTENQSRQQKQRSYAVNSLETHEDSPFFQPVKSFR